MQRPVGYITKKIFTVSLNKAGKVNILNPFGSYQHEHFFLHHVHVAYVRRVLNEVSTSEVKVLIIYLWIQLELRHSCRISSGNFRVCNERKVKFFLKGFFFKLIFTGSNYLLTTCFPNQRGKKIQAKIFWGKILITAV